MRTALLTTVALLISFSAQAETWKAGNIACEATPAKEGVELITGEEKEFISIGKKISGDYVWISTLDRTNMSKSQKNLIAPCGKSRPRST